MRRFPRVRLTASPNGFNRKGHGSLQRQNQGQTAAWQRLPRPHKRSCMWPHQPNRSHKGTWPTKPRLRRSASKCCRPHIRWTSSLRTANASATPGNSLDWVKIPLPGDLLLFRSHLGPNNSKQCHLSVYAIYHTKSEARSCGQSPIVTGISISHQNRVLHCLLSSAFLCYPATSTTQTSMRDQTERFQERQ